MAPLPESLFAVSSGAVPECRSILWAGSRAQTEGPLPKLKPCDSCARPTRLVFSDRLCHWPLASQAFLPGHPNGGAFDIFHVGESGCRLLALYEQLCSRIPRAAGRQNENAFF